MTLFKFRASRGGCSFDGELIGSFWGHFYYKGDQSLAGFSKLRVLQLIWLPILNLSGFHGDYKLKFNLKML